VRSLRAAFVDRSVSSWETCRKPAGFIDVHIQRSELREVAYRHQRQLYGLFFRASASALQQLAADPRFVGGQLGMLGVLQTWTRDLRYHPHIHYLIPAIGLASDGR
jgi:putative transposase